MLLALLIASALAAQPTATPAAPASATPLVTPATIPGAVQFDLTSKITGRTYRIYVAKPLIPPPKAGYPIVYLMDGDVAFGSAAASMTLGQTGSLRPGLIVGVAYPGANALQTMSLRNKDLTPTAPDAATRGIVAAQAPGGEFGGGEGFYRFLTEELRPVVEARFPTDANDRTLMGYSLGGLFTLGALFAHPTDFKTYVVGSPSIWWNGREVLKGEAGFAQAVAAGKAAPRVLVTSAAWEQDAHMLPPHTPNPEPMMKMVAYARMVDNARDLAARLKALKGGPGYEVRYAIFEGETHNSGIPAATARGVQFALEPAP